MKTTISDLVIAFFDLVEAEGRVLRRQTVRVGIGLGCVGLALFIALIGVAFLLWGGYQLLLLWLSPATAALVMALAAGLLAAVFLVSARWLTR